MSRPGLAPQLVWLLGVLGVPAGAAVARAQGVTDIEVPIVIVGETDQSSTQADEALDLANIVQSAAKGVTTVQEAPAIVTVVTADEIKDRQFQTLEELIDTVPGWYRSSVYYSTFPTPLVRGQVQAAQYLTDGLSMFDPQLNLPNVNRVVPLETVKRAEMITGPGGVLWGSNSLLGILNVITKDAEDVDGVEVGGQAGSGRGDNNNARAYVMAGHVVGKWKFFGHASVETYQGALFDAPILYFHDALPQPNSANSYGPLVRTDQARSTVIDLSAKVTYDKLQLRVQYPFGRMYKPLGLSGNPSIDQPNANDPKNVSQLDRSDLFDRYAVLEYHDQFANGKAGITAHVYGQQFIRGFQRLQVLTPSPLLQGGLSFSTEIIAYRAGGAVDGDLELTKSLRVLYGGEAFHEWKPSVETTNLLGPYNLNLLPVTCPRIYDPSSPYASPSGLAPVANCPLLFGYPGDRTVMGAYIDPQFRPNKKLIFDVGARIQVAPKQLGSIGYDATTTLAGTMVWNFVPNWHLKLNYAEGFRPPVFNNLLSNGEGVQFGGRPDLQVEKSKAGQAEVNARIFKGDRRIRELSFRVDASYTRLQNLIEVLAGTYANSADRGLTSGEFFAKLYLQGGHRIELGYTYLVGVSNDKGALIAIPNNWFNLATVWNLVTNKLTATTNLKVAGASQDPNRLVEYRGLMPGSTDTLNVAATDLVLDRLPPIAELTLGMQYTPTPKLAIRATVYNAFYAHEYEPDQFSDYEPHLEYLPSPYEGFRAYVSAMYQY